MTFWVVGQEVGPGGIRTTPHELGGRLWSAVWWSWEAWIPATPWVHAPPSIASYSSSGCHPQAHHEDGWRYCGGRQEDDQSQCLAINSFLSLTFVRNWTAKSAYRSMPGLRAINTLFWRLLCIILQMIGNSVRFVINYKNLDWLRVDFYLLEELLINFRELIVNTLE